MRLLSSSLFLFLQCSRLSFFLVFPSLACCLPVMPVPYSIAKKKFAVMTLNKQNNEIYLKVTSYASHRKEFTTAPHSIEDINKNRNKQKPVRVRALRLTATVVRFLSFPPFLYLRLCVLSSIV